LFGGFFNAKIKIFLRNFGSKNILYFIGKKTTTCGVNLSNCTICGDFAKIFFWRFLAFYAEKTGLLSPRKKIEY
jgi:hypothetical protein